METTSELLTLSQVAERMAVTKMTVRRYLDNGRFPNARRKDGRKDGLWLVPMDDVISSGLGQRYRHKPLPQVDLSPTDVPNAAADGDVAALMETVRSQARTIEQLTAIIAKLTSQSGGAH